MATSSRYKRPTPLQQKLHEIIFEADTPAGKWFDVGLLIAIVLSIIAVMLETVEPFSENHRTLLNITEWVLTGLFTIEYAARLYAVTEPRKYAMSFYGIIDLLAILPTYLSIFIPGTESFLVIRALRILRVFRIFKLTHFLAEGRLIVRAMEASREKITVFFLFVLLMVTILGSIMYLIEGGVNPDFSSIPKAVYWAIVTLTTVGYGDITPVTGLGQFLSAFVMILGYAVIAVPTGIVTAELVHSTPSTQTQACPACGREGHDDDALFCKYCGAELYPEHSST